MSRGSQSLNPCVPRHFDSNGILPLSGIVVHTVRIISDPWHVQVVIAKAWLWTLEPNASKCHLSISSSKRETQRASCPEPFNIKNKLSGVLQELAWSGFEPRIFRLWVRIQKMGGLENLAGLSRVTYKSLIIGDPTSLWSLLFSLKHNHIDIGSQSLNSTTIGFLCHWG